MIRIFLESELDKEFVSAVKSNDELWDYPVEELDYILKELKNEDFILIEDRLYEIG